MPIYQYRCKACSREFEELQKFSEKPLVTCPSCKKKRLVRVIGGSGLVFKGSGFYLTDYKNTSRSDSEQKPVPAPEKKTETKSEAKTETKSEEVSSKSGSTSDKKKTSKENKDKK